ncbi:MAG: ParB/RepB/Spo0J family partition protein [Alphaproteobacteria bacterium]|nr:MAG: ParB/RepB/Spo0J family partition protein [Alphaproteobacteria bacterium]
MSDKTKSAGALGGGRARGLGRGLTALLGEVDASTRSRSATGSRGSVRRVPIETLRAGRFQPRRHFTAEDLGELAASIRRNGMLQPILVRPLEGEEAGTESGESSPVYEIVAGERRWRAAQAAGLHEVPIVERRLDDAQTLEIALVENIQRRDLTPIEEAEGFQRLIEEFGHSAEEIGRVVGKSRSHVANLLRLLKLPEEVREMVNEGALSMGHARALVGLDNALELARQTVAHGLSVRALEALVAAEKENLRPAKNKRRPSPAAAKDADTRALETTLEQALGLKADIRHRCDGSGELRLHYRDLEQLDELCRRLQGEDGF